MPLRGSILGTFGGPFRFSFLFFSLPLGRLLGASWAPLGHPLGTSWTTLEASWGPKAAQRLPKGSPKASQSLPKGPPKVPKRAPWRPKRHPKGAYRPLIPLNAPKGEAKRALGSLLALLGRRAKSQELITESKELRSKG